LEDGLEAEIMSVMAMDMGPEFVLSPAELQDLAVRLQATP